MSDELTREQALAYLKAATNQHDVYSMEKVMAHDAALRAKLADTDKVLRRELAKERAQVRRIIKTQPRYLNNTWIKPPALERNQEDGDFINLRDLLTALICSYQPSGRRSR
jgi:uncharacterized protein YdiU (UPF0061 family)